jgi:hypothetical protein
MTQEPERNLNVIDVAAGMKEYSTLPHDVPVQKKIRIDR